LLVTTAVPARVAFSAS
jgi:hypothetical protein